MGAATAPGTISTHNIEFAHIVGAGSGASNGSGTTECEYPHGISKPSTFCPQQEDGVEKTTTTTHSATSLSEMTFSKPQDMNAANNQC